MNTKKLFSYFFAAALFATALFGFSSSAHANANDNVSGWGWSSTIGWISLNCTDPGTCTPATDYGVRVDIATGNMSGYAWSSNVGWVSFNPSDTASVCPTSAAAHINMNTGVVSGWARATAGTNISGWNGCISLSGSNPAYGLSMNTQTGALSGFAWGSTVVGWINFNGLVVLTPNQPLLVLNADQTQLSAPGHVQLMWNSVNVQPASCTAPWTTQTASIGNEPNVPVNQTTTFTISCMANNTSITASVTVTVAPQIVSLVLQANPTAVQSNNLTTDLTWSSPDQTNFDTCTMSASPATSTWSGAIRLVEVPNAINGYTHTKPNVSVPSQANQSTTYTLTCTDSSSLSNNQATATAVVSVFAPTPAVTLAAQPASLPALGGSSTLTWTASNVSSCGATSNPGGLWTGAKNPNGGSDVIPSIVTTTGFTITCQSSYSQSPVTASTTVYVAGTAPCSTCAPQAPPIPKFIEF